MSPQPWIVSKAPSSNEIPRSSTCTSKPTRSEATANTVLARRNDQQDPEPSVLDAGLIAAGQQVEHYEIAVYGAVCALAEQLGHSDQAALLRQTLNEEREADLRLRELAALSVNPDAVLAVVNARDADDTARPVADATHRGAHGR